MTVEPASPLNISPPPEPPAEDVESSEEPAAPYDYGTTTEEVPAGYVSDAELLAWLQAKSTGQYGALDGLMDTSNERSDLIKKLSQLRKSLDDGQADPAKLLADIETLRATFAGTEYAGELEKTLGPIEDTLEREVAALGSVGEATGTDDAEPSIWAETTKAQFRGELQRAAGSIDAVIKSLEHDDQLALVQIQALMSEIRETAQLTSNIISNRSQTSDSIVGNIRA